MANTKHQTVRLDDNLKNRLENLRALMTKRAGGTEIDLSNVLRNVLLRGLPILEKEMQD